MHITNKGFLLVDSLITVFICTCMCMICFSMYKSNEYYDDGYKKYVDRSNNHLEDLFLNMQECKACAIDESD